MSLPLEADLAGVGPIEPGDEIEQGGLAGAVRADDADQLAFGEVEIDGVDRGEAAEAPRQPAQESKDAWCDAVASDPSDRSQQALRPEPHQQQQHDAVDQDAVLRRDPEHLRQADQRDRADDRAGDVAESAQDHDRQRQDRTAAC